MTSEKAAPARALLGSILLERGLVTQAQLAQALRVQVGGVRRLGHILVRMKVVSDENITDAIARQLGVEVVGVAGAFREEARTLLPRHLCRRFGVIPLALERNNVLLLGMADPLDREAIEAVEHFTGLAVAPALARLGDILREIPRRVAFSRHDVFNPEVYRGALVVAAASVILLGALLGLTAYRAEHTRLKGTATITADSIIYKNHDLMVDAASAGTIHLSGRGAYAEGHFGVTFDGPAQMQAFVEAQDHKLSREQRGWLDWLMREKLAGGRPGAATATARRQE